VVNFWMQIAARERWIDRLRFIKFVAHLKPWDRTAGGHKRLSRVARPATSTRLQVARRQRRHRRLHELRWGADFALGVLGTLADRQAYQRVVKSGGFEDSSNEYDGPIHIVIEASVDREPITSCSID